MPASSSSQLKGGRNHISIGYLSPQVDLGNIIGIDKPVSGIEWWTMDSATKLWTIAGNLAVTDEAYGPAWDGSMQVPTKNALFDKFGTLVGSLISDLVYDATNWNGVADVAPSKNAVRDKIEALGLVSGTYTPTLTGIANAATGSASPSVYLASGIACFVAGNATLTASVAGVDTQFGLGLPVGVTVATSNPLGGTASAVYSAPGMHATIGRDGASGRAKIQYVAPHTAACTVSFIFGYVIN